MKHFAALALVLAWPLVGYGVPDSAAALFLDRCSTCHTVGQPDEVLDLGVAVTWSVPDLRAAVLRMEDNAGPMTPEEIDAIVGLLKSPDLSARLADDAPKSEKPAESGSADTGRRLFYGEQPAVPVSGGVEPPGDG